MEPPPLLVLAHGAGAPSTSAWMVAWRDRLASLGAVFAFDYPYMSEGRRMPDPLPRLVTAHRAAIERARASLPAAAPLILLGKSMGGRVGCHVALEDPSVAALVCFGYPLVASGGRRAVRDEILLALRTPVLFVQGSRDPLCPLAQLATVRARMQAKSELWVVEGGDHSLELSAAERRARDRTQAASDGAVLAAVASFIARHAAPPRPPFSDEAGSGA